MSVFKYKKYKISLNADSKKTQGLRTGDIVRRQYFDGANLIYSLMCVLENGTDKVTNPDTGEVIGEKPYFIGALLEPTDGVIKSDELLDFARITNLFDSSRSGAMYLTASDDQSPYMDVIDGIGRNSSLCYPESLATEDYEDPETQYVVRGVGDAVTATYEKSELDNYRICHIKRNDSTYYDFLGLQQEFRKFVQNPNRVLISYKIRASRNMTCAISLRYEDETRTDGTEDVAVTTEWQYKFHAITVDYSGRYTRMVKLDLSNMKDDDEVWISDFNIILLSSVSNFGEASKIRIGKLDGVNDPVFGTLDGYGGYLQKLFASKSAHISGTLTAGDENGFAATFYAGKIHRNAFINSLDVNFATAVKIDGTIDNPTGVGNVYSSSGTITMLAQTQEWYAAHVGQRYTFSFWVYVTNACALTISQNNKKLGVIQIEAASALSWYRQKITFDIQPYSTAEELKFAISAAFNSEDDGEKVFYFTAPQLEKGEMVTQYQPTDSVLNETEDYGAWFSQGGIGGTIQNPLLKLNSDGEGSIGTKTNSLLLKTDGSGHLANQNIKWNKAGDVTFGKNVTMGWDNLDNSVKEELISKSIRISGVDTFTLLGDLTGADPTTSPADITLTLEEENMQSTSSQRQWYYLQGYDLIPFEGENGKTLTILPFADYWDNANTLTVQCIVNYLGEKYSATFTIRRQYIVGYSIEITSSKGTAYKNNECATILTANVYYQGKLVDPEYVAANYTFKWSKYHLPDMENEIEGWEDEIVDADGNVLQPAIDKTQQSITLNYGISGQDCYVCELLNGSMFPYEFPLIF